MPLYQDNEAERLDRIERLLRAVRPKKASLGPADHQLRRELGCHQDRLLEELRGPLQPLRHTTRPTR